MKTWMIVLALTFACLIFGCRAGSSPSVQEGGSGSGGSMTSSVSGSGSGGVGGSAIGSNITVSTADQNQAPVPDVPVVVNDAAGAVVLVTKSGADGTVPVTVPPGGSVATFSSYGLLGFYVQAVVAPPDGATVLFTIVPTQSSPPPMTTTFNVTLTQIPAGTHEVDVYACGNTGQAYPPGFLLTMYLPRCDQYATSSFVAVAIDAQKKLVGWGAALDQPNAPGGLASVQIALTHTEFDAISDTISSGASNLGVDIYGHGASTSPFLVLLSDYLMSGSKLEAQLAFPKGLFKSYEVREYATVASNANASSSLERSRVYAVLPSASTFSPASMAIVSVNPLDASDPVHPTVTWSASAGPRGDYGYLSFAWSGGTASNFYNVSFPPDHVPSFRTPDIPPELGSFAPAKTSTFGYTHVGYFDDERVNGYDESALFHDVPPEDGLGFVWSMGATSLSSP